MYLQIEEQLQSLIYKKYLGYVPEGEDAVLIQNIDDACLYYELKHYMNEELFEQEPVIMSDLEFKFVPMQEVEDEFIRLFNMLVEEIEENA